MIAPLPSDIFRPGQILNNTYEIEGVLGRGGTGEVYRACNQVSGRVVAIKALSAQFSGKADYVDLMRREEEMRNIQHDAVVRYTECSRTDDGHVFLVMDFVDGASLNEVMLSRRLSARELMIVAHRVAEGLVATHARGIVHRDLSPDNIILRGGDPESAVIIDFGIAKDTAAGARTIVGDSFAGKYEYAAPEQVDGRVDARSDLYALGAVLLAAWRGAVPFQGATPGEIVRSKQRPLDTAGVPEPLNHLIEWLAAPDPDQRPRSAAEVVARIETELRPPAPPAAATARRRLRWGWLLLPVAALVGLGFAWTAGFFDALLAPAIPVANPYVLTASHASSGEGHLSGHAPDAAAAELLRSTFLETTPAGTTTLDLAAGVPVENWAARVASLVDLLSGAEAWELALDGRRGEITAVAPDAAGRDVLLAAIGDWAATAGFDISPQIAVGPERLPVEVVQAVLDEAASCGPLSQVGMDGPAYAMDDTINVAGNVAAADDAGAIEGRLKPIVGDRRMSVNVQILNEDLCAIRSVLPIAPSDQLTIWLGQGETGEANMSGVYHVGDNPVVEVVAPATLEGSLWVFYVDNIGKVYHVLPNKNRLEHALSELGEVENGVRRIRVLYSLAEYAEDKALLAIDVPNENFGKSEIVAIVSKTDLFDMRRPRDESVASAAEALTAALAGREDEIVAVANRVIETRE